LKVEFQHDQEYVNAMKRGRRKRNGKKKKKTTENCREAL
jgi:hypothetical protein